MSIACRCPVCGTEFEAPGEQVGQKVDCPECAAAVLVAASAASRKPPRARSAVPPPAAKGAALPAVSGSASHAPPPAAPAEAIPPAAVPPLAAGAPRSAASAAAIPAPTFSPRRTRSMNRTSVLGLLIALGTLVVGLAVVAGVYVATRPPGTTAATVAGAAGVGDSPSGTAGAVESRGPDGVAPAERDVAALRIEWDEAARKGATLFVDDDERDVPESGPVAFSLPPGKHHIVILRRQYEQVDLERDFRAGETFAFKPDWKQVAVSEASIKFSPGFEDWIQDFEEAKRIAAEQRKDVFLLFDGSDWSTNSKMLASDVFFQQEFRQRVAMDYVLVLVDFPKGEQAKAKVEDPARNERLGEQFGVDDYPTVVLTDETGRPYGIQGYVRGGVATYMEEISGWRTVDSLLRNEINQIEQDFDPAERRIALERALGLLRATGLVEMGRFYTPVLEGWLPALDGAEDSVVCRYWSALFRLASYDAEAVNRVVAKFDEWRKDHKIEDPDFAAGVHLNAAVALYETSQPEKAKARSEEGLACKPEDGRLRRYLERMRDGQPPSTEGEEHVGTGSGFAVATAGYVLTNFHVIRGAKELRVLLYEREDKLPANVVASDEKGDMALLKVELPEDVKLEPIAISAADAQPGEEVCALGFPFIGGPETALKITRGIVSGRPTEAEDEMIALDVRVNPGNSGGPLFNRRGQVLGMVTAKSFSDAMTDSFGLATPADRLREFLKKHLPGFEPAPDGPAGKDLSWQEVHQRFAPSVVKIENVQ
jgi:S1-C subfamily serine protease